MCDRAALTPTLRHWTFPNKRKENRSRKLYEVFSKEKKITLPQDNRSIPVLKSGRPNPNATALDLPKPKKEKLSQETANIFQNVNWVECQFTMENLELF